MITVFATPKELLSYVNFRVNLIATKLERIPKIGCIEGENEETLKGQLIAYNDIKEQLEVIVERLANEDEFWESINEARHD